MKWSLRRKNAHTPGPPPKPLRAAVHCGPLFRWAMAHCRYRIHGQCGRWMRSRASAAKQYVCHLHVSHRYKYILQWIIYKVKWILYVWSEYSKISIQISYLIPCRYAWPLRSHFCTASLHTLMWPVTQGHSTAHATVAFPWSLPELEGQDQQTLDCRGRIWSPTV